MSSTRSLIENLAWYSIMRPCRPVSPKSLLADAFINADQQLLEVIDDQDFTLPPIDQYFEKSKFNVSIGYWLSVFDQLLVISNGNVLNDLLECKMWESQYEMIDDVTLTKGMFVSLLLHINNKTAASYSHIADNIDFQKDKETPYFHSILFQVKKSWVEFGGYFNPVDNEIELIVNSSLRMKELILNREELSTDNLPRLHIKN